MIRKLVTSTREFSIYKRWKACWSLNENYIAFCVFQWISRSLKIVANTLKITLALSENPWRSHWSLAVCLPTVNLKLRGPSSESESRMSAATKLHSVHPANFKFWYLNTGPIIMPSSASESTASVSVLIELPSAPQASTTKCWSQGCAWSRYDVARMLGICNNFHCGK